MSGPLSRLDWVGPYPIESIPGLGILEGNAGEDVSLRYAFHYPATQLTGQCPDQRC
jgi:hypothetical protein